MLPLCIPQVLCDSVSLGKEKQTREGQGHVSMQPGGSVTDRSKGGILGTEITIELCCPPTPWHPHFKLSKTNMSTLTRRADCRVHLTSALEDNEADCQPG